MSDTAPEAAHIAVVGLGCRVPGADSPTALWQLLLEGRDEIIRVPEDRTQFTAALRAVGEHGAGAQWGGFLEDIGRWDPAFFGISPAEAAAMDPQQALALEVSWRALENAGVVPDELAGSRTGVFFGQATHDHAMLLGAQPQAAAAGPFTNPGLAHSITANRLSYLWDLRGPSLAVDTACSSSLVAVHLAAQSLLTGECDLALAGGVNALLSPVPQLGAAALTALAPDGRCRTFDAAGKGYVRSEGAGAVVLRRLDDALADGDHIHAVLRATAVNQDGRTNGLTAPSGRAQTELIAGALRRAGITGAEQLGFVELHGTGTPLGDPIEARALATALADTLGEDRPPLAVGSIKANIGHLEAAAGILGLIKAALVLSRGVIPRNPHFTHVNPRIDLDAFRLRVPSTDLPWPDQAHCAAVSSFGFGGTNASAIIARTPNRSPVRRGVRAAFGPALLPLSARNEDALAALAGSWAEHVRTADTWAEIQDAARAAAVHRTHFAWRAGLVAADREELLGQLDKVATRSRPISPTAPVPVARLGFVYSGHGSQWNGMGRELLRTSAAFARRVEEIDTVFAPLLGWSPLRALRGERNADLDDISVAQPLIMTVQLALTAGLAELGIRPDAVVGHSMGEVSAAVAGQRLDLTTACRVLRARNDAVEAARGRGGMAVVEAGADEARTILRDAGSPVTVAADNSPRTCVLSGAAADLADAMTEFERRGRDARLVKVDYPSHGPLMRGPAQRLVDALGHVEQPAQNRAEAIDFYSSVQGGRFDGPLDTAYWKENLTSPVRAREAINAMADHGMTHLLEISPHPVLLAALGESVEGRSRPVTALATAYRDRPVPHGLHDVAAALYEHGRRPDAVADDITRHWAPRLPGHPFQRHQAHKPPQSVPAARTVPGDLTEVALQPGTFIAELTLPAAREEHHVAGRPALSAAELVALASWAADQAGLGEGCRIRDVDLRRRLPADAAVPLQLALLRGGGHAHPSSALVSFLFRESGRWTAGATCTVGVGTAPEPFPIRSAMAQVEVTVPAQLLTGRPAQGPSLLDPALPGLADALFDAYDNLPRLDEFTVARIGSAYLTPRLWSADRGTAYGWLHEADDQISIDLALVDSAGELLAQIQGVALQHLSELPGPSGSAPSQAQTSGESASSAPSPLRDLLDQATSTEERRTRLTAWLRAALGSILPGGLPAADPDQLLFAELGLESLMGVELRNRLERELGVRLSVALVWSHPTISQLSAELADVLERRDAPSTASGSGRPTRGAQPQPSADNASDALNQLLAELDSTS
ncbi:type I polyketide synthase [Streptomyces kanamyceticus]|uniref:type I polyketide synthase n=1 Tax=Streptomyces kanamyceticus TaxID=1967 RepID=UPI0006E33409|nr:type I polyketide synthase [Streptomyces kanamyceticus]